MKNSDKIKFIAENIELTRRNLIAQLSAEIDFAEFICEQSGAKKEWGKILENAKKNAEDKLREPNSDLNELILETEDILQPLEAEAKKYTVYCIGHAHIDMNWMWSWPETVAVVNDTFTTVLNLLEKFPEFCFSQSQASIYRIVEQFNPSMLQRIKEFVEEGRWEITASHWVENEANLISGEAMCRHLLYTRRYMKKLFNLEP